MILAAEADQSDMGMDPTGELHIGGLGDPDDDELEEDDDDSDDSDEDPDEMDAARLGLHPQPSSGLIPMP